MQLTKSELAILRLLSEAPGQCAEWFECRTAAGLTIRGGRTVINRLLGMNWVRPSDLPQTYRWPTLTSKGADALASAGVAA